MRVQPHSCSILKERGRVRDGSDFSTSTSGGVHTVPRSRDIAIVLLIETNRPAVKLFVMELD